MKKIVVILVLSMCVESSYSQFSINGYAGLSVSNQSLSEQNRSLRVFDSQAAGITSSRITGMTIGAEVEGEIGRNLFFSVGVEYTQKGQIETVSNVSYTFKDRINYLVVPIKLVLRLPHETGMVNVSTGVYTGLGVGGKTTFRNNGDSEGELAFKSSLTMADEYNSTNLAVKPNDFGVVFGLETGGEKLGFFITYQLGLTDIHPKDSDLAGGHPFNRRVIKTRSLSLGLKYRYKLKKE